MGGAKSRVCQLSWMSLDVTRSGTSKTYLACGQSGCRRMFSFSWQPVYFPQLPRSAPTLGPVRSNGLGPHPPMCRSEPEREKENGQNSQQSLQPQFTDSRFINLQLKGVSQMNSDATIRRMSRSRAMRVLMTLAYIHSPVRLEVGVSFLAAISVTALLCTRFRHPVDLG